MFTMYVVDEEGTTHEPGSVKIGEVGLQARGGGAPLEPGFRAPTLPRAFDALDEMHFSVGQTENYYETLNALDPDFKNQILEGLRDCAFNLQIFDANFDEEVMSESLLRSVPQRNVRNRFHRLAHGNALLTRFEFEYVLPDPQIEGILPPVLGFNVVPESEPPTNVHVLIGRNGVGKTRCVQNLSMAVLGIADENREHGELRLLGDNAEESGSSFTVLAGSMAKTTWSGQPHSYEQLRVDLQTNGSLKASADGPWLVFTQDVPFKSPSAASAIHAART